MTRALNTMLSDLRLPGRVTNALRRNGYFFLRDLLGVSRAELLRIRHFGCSSLTELEDSVRHYGLIIWADDPQERFGLDPRTITTMSSTFAQLRVELSLQAEQLELLLFVLSNEWARILRDSPGALYQHDSYASRLAALRDQILIERDRNLIPHAASEAAA